MKIGSLFAIVVELDDEFGVSNFMMRTSTFLPPELIFLFTPRYWIEFALNWFCSRNVVIVWFISRQFVEYFPLILGLIWFSELGIGLLIPRDRLFLGFSLCIF